MIANIWAVGRNYADHAKELGNAIPSAGSEPMIFLKAGSTRVASGGVVRLPEFSKDVHHEVEVALRFGPDLEPDAFAIALDLTARDVQMRLKDKGHPWTLAKSFIDSCPLGDFKALGPRGVAELADVEFFLEVNGERRQTGRTSAMTTPIPELVRYVRSRFPVQPGDVLLTGTPAGVGPLRAGDRLVAEITGRTRATWTVTGTGL